MGSSHGNFGPNGSTLKLKTAELEAGDYVRISMCMKIDLILGSGSGYPVPEFVFWGTFSGFTPGPLEGRKTTSFWHSATVGLSLSQLSSFESQVSLVKCMFLFG